MDLQDNVFMLPGPVKIHPRVLAAMSVPSVAHRSKDFSAVNAEIRELLKYLFKSENDVAVMSGSGTAGLETAIVNLVNRDEKILTTGNGKFGERLGEIARIYTDPTDILTQWGEPIDLERIAVELETGMYKAVAVCHNETSTALTNPVEEVGKLARKHDVIFILDGITSVGGLDVDPERIGADIVVFGSQKCIAAPAGLAALSVSDRAKEVLHDDTSYYLNLNKHIKKLRDGDQTPYTPAIPLHLALREALRMVKEEGIDNRVSKIAAMADATRAAVKALDLDLFPNPDYASDTVTAIRYPDGISDADFRGALLNDYNVIVAGAQAEIKGKVFRIGHMGICSWTDLVATFGAIEAVLTRLGYDLEKGASVAAVVDAMTRFE